jgi:C4-dicarboxylate-specific signal transduction histidine kinase
MAALRGVEKAAAIAVCHGQHWIAAMAWEQAVHLAQECGFTSAVQHYRQQTLTSYQNWGAFGRVDMLRREWNEAEVRLAGVQNAENERAVRVGAVGEPRLAIAHEVNQPLAAITLHAAAARKWLRRPQPDIERALSSLSLISAAGRYAGDIVRSVQRLASRQENELHDVTVDQTIGDALQLLHQPLRRHGIEVELALGLGACTIRASRVQLQQVVMNLLMNAIEALATGGAGQRRIRLESRRDTDHVEVLVSDNGPGILDADRDRVFTSMFSTKPKNTGMGLSISLSIIRAHGGQLVFNPCHPHGACFRFRLPMNLDQKLPLSTDRAAN